MRGGRNFPSRNNNFPRNNRGGFRGNSDSNYRGNGSSSRYDSQSNGRSNYSGASSSAHYNSTSSSGGRSRFQAGSSRNSDNRRSSYGSSYRDRADSPDRKRFRHEGGGSRRDFNNSSDHGRFDSHNSGSSYRQKKRSSPSPSQRSPFRDSSRNSNNQRPRDNMGPPTRFPPRKVGNTYRGRPAPARGIRRARVAPARGPRSNIVRRRITREQDTARRAKIARLRSSIKKHSVSEKTSKPEGDDDGNSKKTKNDENDEKSGDETEVQNKKAIAKSRVKKSASENGDGNNEAGEEEELDESADVVDIEEPEGDEIETATDEKKHDADGSKKKERSLKKDGSEKESSSRKNYMPLKCVHCRKTYTTFHEYNSHLHFRGHKNALRRVALEQKSKILKMRYLQRQAQREVDGDTKNSSGETTFCMLCRLNYKSPKADHQASQEHREMKKFLMPFCKTCRIGFKSPMDYEVHRCTLDHVKRDSRRTKKEDDEEAELQVDLDEFTLVDSVGDIDGIQTNENEDSDEKGDDTINPDINVGAEYVKKVEAFYCDLCHFFLPLNKDPEESLKRHCNIRSHLRNYLRHQEDQSLRLCAEKIHRRHQGEKGDETAGDKVWEDVDKDLGELLEQTDKIAAGKDEDEDEDSTTTTERYDRFKNSEKTNNSDEEKIKIEDTEGGTEGNEDAKE